ncbi:MAG: pantoate--beta-alanine ligase [Alphaproteobacteria bacterium]|nr:pantoate--beta-alanine ligase [Alphaproteobacteria bacterium]
MQTIHDRAALTAILNSFRAAGENVALVPTMGALHDGHLALVADAKMRAARVVVSIFVNPKQFGPNEDFDAYPRRAEADSAKLIAAGVDVLWMPPVDEMYPAGFATNIRVEGLPDRLCGAARPGHFDGVATVVAKLFNQVRPDIAIFGEKDWQQLAIIRRMAADLDLGVEVVGFPTQREEDGLALSSRNAYLTPDERAAAVALPRALEQAARAVEGGEEISAALAAVPSALLKAGFSSVDYVELVAADTLIPLEKLDRPGRLLAAARIGKARLIDNLAVLPN